MQSMKRALLKGLTIQAALVIGFGLTLGLWVFAGWYFTDRIATVQRDAEAINARYMRAQELLTTARSEVLFGSLSVRDALLDPDPVATVRTSETVQQKFQLVDVMLRQYVPILDSHSEHERVERLRVEINGLNDHMRQVLERGVLSTSEARELLNSKVIPQRELVLRVSDEVQALNRAAFVRQQSDIAAVYRSTQRGMWAQLGFALAASLAIALLATIYASRLEARLRHQHEREEQHAESLQRLSAKLIAAQEEERRGIARELHDELGQVLSAIKVEIAIARRALEGAPAYDTLTDAETMADSALTTVRDLSRLLHPAMLDDLGLPAAVDSYLRGFGARYGLRVELLIDRMDDRLQPETEVTAYRVIQEALTNVARHAQAQSCRVYLQRLAATVLITIEDDGVGFDAEEATRPELRTGLGLLGIRERASLLHGTLRLESTRGAGTRLTVELPAAPRSRDAEDTDTVVTPRLTATEALHG
jgi:signal transduction histidine kinase